MDYAEIQSLKALTTNLIKKGCRLKIPKYGVDGKLDGIDFKTHSICNPDSKLDKIEFNILDDYGQVVPFNFSNIKAYEILTQANKNIEDSKNISLNIFISSGTSKQVEKIRIDISFDEGR